MANSVADYSRIKNLRKEDTVFLKSEMIQRKQGELILRGNEEGKKHRRVCSVLDTGNRITGAGAGFSLA